MIKKLVGFIIAVPIIIGIGFMATGVYYGGMTIHKLLGENETLKQAITNITDEGKIGYAKVVKQETIDGKLFSTILFVETARDDELQRIVEKEYIIEGDIVHFDALIIKFGNKMVLDGKKKSLYLWRRIYGEMTAPASGQPIETEGNEPERYKDVLAALPAEYRQMFWTNIWQLANDPELLKEYGIEAVYGNVTYSKLKPGLIYIFKITPTGQIYPEIIPDI